MCFRYVSCQNRMLESWRVLEMTLVTGVLPK